MQAAPASGMALAALKAARQVGRTPIILLLLWLVVLWWGERAIWQRSASACSWKQWEQWPVHAEPHHVLLVADPQLVDPHTYPGRPWPLSTITVWITDLYMRRSYNALLNQLEPHSTLFLGDLFDGGREWATGPYASPDASLKSYGTKFWLKEYGRFMNMFVDSWHKHKLHEIPSPEGRRIIASLPGNHDLGFAGGIEPTVKARFDAHFGPMNRIDIIGNHTFVSLDTVSFSAMDQIDPETGSSGSGDGTGKITKSMQIWKPTEDFLENARSLRARSVARRFDELRTVARQDPVKADGRMLSSLFPTVLLTHVPLFRAADTSCGPMRERGSSIPISAGYQYQNVLTPLISADIVKHLDADQMTMIYSGDDHDYCEIEHGEFTGRIREITVKSTSMAMGVSRPGVQLASLWNPIDIDIKTNTGDFSARKNTVQNHLCLLPHQEGIFLRYLQVLILTIVALSVRALRYRPEEAYQKVSGMDKDSAPLLPLSRKSTPPVSPHLSAANVLSTSNTPAASARSRNGRSLGGYGNLPSTSRSVSPVKLDIDSTEPSYRSPLNDRGHNRKLSESYPLPSFPKHNRWHSRLFWPSTSRKGELLRTTYLVAVPALCFYLWLIWNG